MIDHWTTNLVDRYQRIGDARITRCRCHGAHTWDGKCTVPVRTQRGQT